MSKEYFKKISNFVIPNVNLCGKLNILKLDKNLSIYNEEQSFDEEANNDAGEVKYLISIPVNVENPNKYKRGSFEFNFCFILEKESFENEVHRDIVQHIIKKMACILTQMELENDFLSCNLADSPPKSDMKDPKM